VLDDATVSYNYLYTNKKCTFKPSLWYTAIATLVCDLKADPPEGSPQLLVDDYTNCQIRCMLRLRLASMRSGARARIGAPAARRTDHGVDAPFGAVRWSTLFACPVAQVAARLEVWRLVWSDGECREGARRRCGRVP
jgi:hypothetical protein